MREIRVSASRDYDVVIGEGLMDEAGERLAKLLPAPRSVCVAAGEKVSALYGARLAAALKGAGYSVYCFTYAGGERHKDLETYSNLLAFLAEHRFSRSDVLVALGGGVTGDVAGFAAATYQRGIPFVQVPTTLLAAVDSSVGGKTAVNLKSGKNQVGSFYQPHIVLCDTTALDTLPPEEYRCGCAEVIKYGVLCSESFFEELDEKPVSAQAEHVIAACVEMKRDIVAVDEFDTGRRQFLNLGHSFGHAIEKCSNYEIRHGEAVAAGMAIIARAACARGVCGADTVKKIENILVKYSLPTKTDFSAAALYEAMLSDKKISGGKINLILPERIGCCRIEPVEAAALSAWLRDGGVL